MGSRGKILMGIAALAVVLLGLGSATLLLLTTVLPQATATQWIAGLGVGGAVAVAAYLALEPACIAGPFGQADPRIGPIWLHRVIETQSILQLADRIDDPHALVGRAGS